MNRHHGNPVIACSRHLAAWMTIAMKWVAKRAIPGGC